MTRKMLGTLRLRELAILLLVVGCADKRDAPTPVTIKTPDGSITAMQVTVDPTPQKITVVTGDELQRLASLGSDGPAFVTTYAPDAREFDLKDYDRAFRAWQLSDAPQHSKDQVVEIVGGYLGNKCVEDLDMEWVTVTDKLGTDYAIRGKSVEVVAFPFSTVLKRVEHKEYDFVYGVYHAMKQMKESGEYKSREPTATAK